jgi:hypothetical protein
VFVKHNVTSEDEANASDEQDQKETFEKLARA